MNYQSCALGGMALTCGVNAGDSPWFAANSEAGTKKWKAFAHIEEKVITGGAWAQTTFDTSKLGKVNIGCVKRAELYGSVVFVICEMGHHYRCCVLDFLL